MHLALAALFAVNAALPLELVRESLTGTHCRYRIGVDDYVTQPCDAAAPLMTLTTHARSRVRRVIVDEQSLHPFAYDYDVDTGALVRRVPLFFNAKAARVFDPNPVVTLNDPTLQDANDAASAVPESAYRTVQLPDTALHGPWVTIIDRQVPNVPPAEGSLLFDRSADGFEDVNAYFHIDGSQRYLQSLGYTGRRAIAPYAIETDAHAQNGLDNSLFLPSSTTAGIGTLFFGEGGTDDAEDADLVVHEYGHAILEWIAPGTFAGIFSSEARAFSEGFGDYWAFSAHHAQRVASGRDPFCFADWDARCGLDDPSQQCSYPPGADCLRRLDSTRTMANYEFGDSSGVEHRNGQIISSALRELFLLLGKHTTDTIVIESIFGAPPLPTFAVMARRMLDADRLLYGGAHAAAICSVMSSRGIVAGDMCTTVPRGEWTHFQSSARAIPIPEADPFGVVSELTIGDPRAIEKLFVRVDITHPSRGDLRIELIAPDGTIVILEQASLERSQDVHVTFGLDAASFQPLSVFRGRSAAGVWKLRVADLRFRDAGTLLSWGLVIQFAGDAPASERPRAARSHMIPVVAHRHGANETFFASELRLANPSPLRTTATLILTPSGSDGRTSFSAVNVSLEPGQTIAYDDVLETAFLTAGSGSLEILGEVIAMSRTYTRGAGGTLGQQVPPVRDTTTASELPLVASAFPAEGYRYNVGVTETGGGSGIVNVGGVILEIAPFSHLQIPSPAPAVVIRLLSGTAKIGGYISQIDNASGDAIFVPAQKLRDTTVTAFAPVVDSPTWQSDAWFFGGPGSISFEGRQVATRTTIPDVLPTAFGRSNTFGVLSAQLSAQMAGGTRIRHGNTAQFVPLLELGTTGEQLLFIERTPSFRTNIGFVSDQPAVAEVIVYDSAGRIIQRDFLAGANGFAQMPVTAAVVAGRAVVHFVEGHGIAYASLIDNATGDATFIQAQ